MPVISSLKSTHTDTTTFNTTVEDIVPKTKKTTTDKFKRIIDRFAEAKIGVLGDIVADVYIYGKPFRLSREAPVLVIRHDSEKKHLFPG